MTAMIIAKAIPWIIGLIGLLGVYMRGRHNGKVKATHEVMENYAKTRKRMDDAVDTGNDDPALLREWLRERGQ